MPDAIKLQVLDAIVADVRALTVIKTVIINPPEQITLEIALVPAVIIWDEDEDMEQVNRLEVGTFPLHMQVWTHGKLYWRLAENYRAAIKTRLYTSTALKGLAAVYHETKGSKFYQAAFNGGIDTMGTVVYRTNVNDATTQTY